MRYSYGLSSRGLRCSATAGNSAVSASSSAAEIRDGFFQANTPDFAAYMPFNHARAICLHSSPLTSSVLSVVGLCVHVDAPSLSISLFIYLILFSPSLPSFPSPPFFLSLSATPIYSPSPTFFSLALSLPLLPYLFSPFPSVLSLSLILSFIFPVLLARSLSPPPSITRAPGAVI